MWLVASVVVGAAARRRVVGELLPSRRVHVLPLPLAAASHQLLRCYVHEGAWARLVEIFESVCIAYLSQLGLVGQMQAKNQHMHVVWLPALGFLHEGIN